MQNEDIDKGIMDKGINEFIKYITTNYGILAGIATFFPLANVVLNVIPLPVDFYGKSTAPIAIPLTTLACIFVIYYSFVQREKDNKPQQAKKFFLLGFVLLFLFLLLEHFEYPLRVWLSNLTTINLDSTSDYVLMLVGIVPFYILFFACVTQAFTILALIEFKRKYKLNSTP